MAVLGPGCKYCILYLLRVFGGSATPRPRPNFDGFIYIHYAAPPYSTRISAIYLIPFGKVWLGFVCRVQRLATKFTQGGWNLRSYFMPFMDQSSRNFHTMLEIPCTFQRHCPIVYVMFHSEDICHWVSKSSKNQATVKVFWPPIFREGCPRLFYRKLLEWFTVHRLARFGWVLFAGFRLQIY